MTLGNQASPAATRAVIEERITAETIKAPRLTDIKVSDFAIFKEKRAVYERRVQETNENSGIKRRLLTYRSFVDESVLELFLSANWIEASSINDVTEDQIKECIEKKATEDEEDYDLGAIERDLANVSMEESFEGASLEKQVWRLCLTYMTTLRMCGYDRFIETNPKQAIKHIFNRISDCQLQNRMRMILDLHKEVYGVDFTKFIRRTAEEAKTIDLQAFSRRYSVLMDGKGLKDDVKP